MVIGTCNVKILHYNLIIAGYAITVSAYMLLCYRDKYDHRAKSIIFSNIYYIDY